MSGWFVLQVERVDGRVRRFAFEDETYVSPRPMICPFAATRRIEYSLSIVSMTLKRVVVVPFVFTDAMPFRALALVV